MTRVAIIGTGITGAPIAVRLREVGHSVAIWNRTRSKAEALLNTGVELFDTPAAAVRGSEVVGIVVSDDSAIESVLKGPNGVLSGLRDGTFVINFSTTSVDAMLRFGKCVRERGGRPVDAPFFGSRDEAERGGLWAVVGAANKDIDDAKTFLRPLCTDTFHVGDVGDAAALKLAANVLVFTMVNNIAESLALAKAQGVDPGILLSVLEKGTGVRAPIYQAKGKLMLEGDYAPRCTVDIALKDLTLITEAATTAGMRLAATATTKSLFEDAVATGYGHEDMAALYKLVEHREEGSNRQL